MQVSHEGITLDEGLFNMLQNDYMILLPQKFDIFTVVLMEMFQSSIFLINKDLFLFPNK